MDQAMAVGFLFTSFTFGRRLDQFELSVSRAVELQRDEIAVRYR
jgi:hypothetical protein